MKLSRGRYNLQGNANVIDGDTEEGVSRLLIRKEADYTTIEKIVVEKCLKTLPAKGNAANLVKQPATFLHSFTHHCLLLTKHLITDLQQTTHPPNTTALIRF